MRPVAELGEPGIPSGASASWPTTSPAAFPPNWTPCPIRRLVLCAASPGQVSLDSFVLGHSLFGYYFLESLRGWADVDDENGRTGWPDRRARHGVVHGRTGRALGLEQPRGPTNADPVRHAANFNLLALPHGERSPRIELPAPEPYPDWLRADWELLDRLCAPIRATGWGPTFSASWRRPCWLGAEVWRGGYPAADIQKERQPLLDLFRSRIAAVRAASQLPEPRSLALERAQSKVADPAVAAALKELMAQLEPEGGAGPGKPPPPRAALIGGFLEKNKERSYYDIAEAVVEFAVRQPKPSAGNDSPARRVRSFRDLHPRLRGQSFSSTAWPSCPIRFRRSSGPRTSFIGRWR